MEQSTVYAAYGPFHGTFQPTEIVIKRKDKAYRAAGGSTRKDVVTYDPDQYDPDANTGRGSGFSAPSGAPRPTVSARAGSSRGGGGVRVVGGVTYDPDQFDPDNN